MCVFDPSLRSSKIVLWCKCLPKVDVQSRNIEDCYFLVISSLFKMLLYSGKCGLLENLDFFFCLKWKVSIVSLLFFLCFCVMEDLYRIWGLWVWDVAQNGASVFESTWWCWRIQGGNVRNEEISKGGSQNAKIAWRGQSLHQIDCLNALPNSAVC